VFLHEGAFVVEPFEDDEFAAEVGQFVGGTLGVGEGEFRGDLAWFNGGKGEMIEGEGKEGKKKEGFHHSKIPYRFGWSSGGGSRKRGWKEEGGRRKKRKNQGLGSEVIQSIGDQRVPRRKKRLWGQRSKKGGQRSKKLGSEVMFVNVKVKGDFGSG
jgi:hypothetical protein